MQLFGLNIELLKRAEEKSSALTLPVSDDGAAVVSGGAVSAYYGVSLDTDSVLKNEFQSIQKYREIALYPEIDIAIQDIVNEAVPSEDNQQQLKVVIDDKLEISTGLRKKIGHEFEEVLELMNYNQMASDIFRSWYVDGRKYYQIIVDKKNLQNGIVEVLPIDSLKLKKVREIVKQKTESGIDTPEITSEYYLYNEAGFAGTNKSGSAPAVQSNGVKISADAIVYAPSGVFDAQAGHVIGYLQKAIKPVNQLRMLEDATMVYFIARAPERRIFYIDVGNLPKLKAEQYVKEIMNKYRNKMVYDASTGSIKDDKKYMSLLEDFWMPRRENGRSTEITTLPGSQNQQSMLDNVKYFQEKLFQALNVPVSRLQPETGFSMGRTTEISRDEVKFQKFIDRLRKKFSVLFYDLLKTQLILKGIVNDIEWDELKSHIYFEFQTDNYFAELKELDITQARLNILAQANQYVGNYYSKEWIWKHVLHLSDEEIEEMKAQIDSEKGDPTAQVWGQQQLMAPPMPPGVGDPNDPNAQQDPYQFGGNDPSQDQQAPGPYDQQQQ
jgi:hypothetical protein